MTTHPHTHTTDLEVFLIGHGHYPAPFDGVDPPAARVERAEFFFSKKLFSLFSPQLIGVCGLSEVSFSFETNETV